MKGRILFQNDKNIFLFRRKLLYFKTIFQNEAEKKRFKKVICFEKKVLFLIKKIYLFSLKVFCF